MKIENKKHYKEKTLKKILKGKLLDTNDNHDKKMLHQEFLFMGKNSTNAISKTIAEKEEIAVEYEHYYGE